MLGNSIKVYKWSNAHPFVTGQLECVVFYDKIYPTQLIIGGRSTTATKSTIMKLQLDNFTSSYTTAQLSSARSSMQTFSNSTYVWNLGGYANASAPIAMTSFDQMSNSTLTNSSTSSTLATECKYAAAHCETPVYGYTFGGSLNASSTANKVSLTSHVFTFSTITHAEITASTLITACAVGSAVNNNGIIYVAYGRSYTYAVNNRIQLFTEANRTFQASPTYALNQNLSNHSISKNQYNAYYFGGNTADAGTTSISTTRIFSFITLTPSTLSGASVSTTMQDMSIVTDGSMSTAYICGGYKAQSTATTYSYVQTFKHSNHTIAAIQRGTLPTAVYEAGSCRI